VNFRFFAKGKLSLNRELPVRKISLWVDGDACPAAVKQIIFRTAKRLQIPTTLVANQSIAVPKSEFIECLLVPHGADVADKKIVELMHHGDVVVTADIPLASAVVKKGGIAIGPRGERFDDSSVHGRLASRNLMDQLRGAGMETSGPKPLSQKDVQAFANELDRTLTRCLRERS
jgi:uncharacterized protein YaiI (UPF0178 family)